MYGTIHKLNHVFNDCLSVKISHQCEVHFDGRKTSVNINGVKGDLVNDKNENLSNHGIFAFVEFTKGKWALSTQGRYDYGSYHLNDDAFVLKALNGSFAVEYNFTKANKVYVVVTSTFESPTLNEFSAQATTSQL
jgi:outer membrane receptor protein involved in Fe transport